MKNYLPAINIITFVDDVKPFSKQAVVFTCLQYKYFENTVGNGEIACKEQFFLFPNCFLTFGRTFHYFYDIHDCRRQILSVGSV